MLEVLNFNPTADSTKSTTASDIAGVENQSITVDTEGVVAFNIDITGLKLSNTDPRDWIFSIIIDDATEVDCDTIRLRTRDLDERVNVSVSAKATGVTAGSHDVRLRWRAADESSIVTELMVGDFTSISVVAEDSGGGGGGGGDNLGDHTATENLDLDSNDIINAGDVGSTSVSTGAVTLTSINGYDPDEFLDVSRAALAGTDVDFQTDHILTKTLSANTTLTFSNPVLGKMIILEIDSSASETLTLPGTATVLEGEYDSAETNIIAVLCVDASTPEYLVIFKVKP